jgi:hypothetical protein
LKAFPTDGKLHKVRNFRRVGLSPWRQARLLARENPEVQADARLRPNASQGQEGRRVEAPATARRVKTLEKKNPRRVAGSRKV